MNIPQGSLTHQAQTNVEISQILVPIFLCLVWSAQILPKSVFEWLFKQFVLGFKLDQAFLDQYTVFQEDKYQWCDIFPNPWVELKLCFWLPGQGSLAHDHADSRNFTKVVKGKMTARLYKVKKSELIVISEEEVEPNQVLGVERHQVHELINLGTDPCITFHCYCPRRPE
ncbi:cysteine dioxygenase [Laspinema olomoucense]|uniref:cysteine dioxygenase n=1 Tax=Laspinema olomoucense TaxID=3231600 RepID=UPI0021BB36D6|nr:cysteine dioxygenase family protein [Laspinema sp. D3d]MCT7971457.1 cysteine dioxygenase family protein [Laspinema sp. D3d]